jgi:hypothetical protein
MGSSSLIGIVARQRQVVVVISGSDSNTRPFYDVL